MFYILYSSKWMILDLSTLIFCYATIGLGIYLYIETKNVSKYANINEYVSFRTVMLAHTIEIWVLNATSCLLLCSLVLFFCVLTFFL